MKRIRVIILTSMGLLPKQQYYFKRIHCFQRLLLNLVYCKNLGELMSANSVRKVKEIYDWFTCSILLTVPMVHFVNHLNIFCNPIVLCRQQNEYFSAKGIYMFC